MESRWRKAKMSLGLNLCVYVPRTLEGDGSSGSPNTASSTAALVSPVASSSSAATSANTTPTAAAYSPNAALMPTTPTPTSAGLRLSKSGSKSFKGSMAGFAAAAATDT